MQRHDTVQPAKLRPVDPALDQEVGAGRWSADGPCSRNPWQAV